MTQWQETSIGNVCKVIAGQSPKSSAYNDVGDGLPFYQGKKDFADRYLAPPTKWTTSVTKRALPNDILMSVRAPVGPTNVATQEICIGRGLAAIRAGGSIDEDFLWYALMWMQPSIKGNDGAVFPSINKRQIEALELPLPPLDEQKRIVAVLDQAFAALDRARDNAEANLADAEELFGAARDKIVVAACADEPEVILGDFLTKATYGFTNPMPNADHGPWKITAKNVVGGKIDYESARHTTQEAFETALTDKSRPSVGDVLITKDGTLGRTAVVDRDGICVNQSVAVLATDARLDPNFLSEMLATTTIQRSLVERAGGTTIKHLYISRIPETIVQVPNVSKQRAVLERLHQASGQVANILRSAKAKLQDIDDLRQSILQKAFAGELT